MWTMVLLETWRIRLMLRYFPQLPPLSPVLVEGPSERPSGVFAHPGPGSGPPAPGGCLATVVRRRLALSLLQPVTVHTSFSIRPLFFLDALAYAPSVLPGGLGLGPHRQPASHAQPRRDSRGPLQMRHLVSLAGIPDESRRELANGQPRGILHDDSLSLTRC